MRRSKTFPGSQKPEMEGVYERNYNSDGEYSNWAFCLFRNGVWMCSWPSAEEANQECWPSAVQALPWRGLATRDGK